MKTRENRTVLFAETDNTTQLSQWQNNATYLRD